MSCALGAVDLDPVVTQEALEAYDFINVMVYDKTGVWRPNDDRATLTLLLCRGCN